MKSHIDRTNNQNHLVKSKINIVQKKERLFSSIKILS